MNILSKFKLKNSFISKGSKKIAGFIFITYFALSPLASLAGLSTQAVFAEPPSNGVYGYALTVQEAALPDVDIQLYCNPEGGWNNFASTDEDGEYWTTSEDFGQALVDAECANGDTINVRAEIDNYEQVAGGWVGQVPSIFLQESEDIQEWAYRVFSNSAQAYFILESNIEAIDFNETVNKSGTSGVAVEIDDIVIIGGEADDMLDLNLYATGGEFSFTVQGGVSTTGTGSNIQLRGTRDDLNATLQTLTFTSENSGQFRVEARIGGQNGEIYNPENEHIYQIVSGSLTWSAAKTAAEGMTYGGVPGYLATITTPKEHSIITDRISGDGWIGASDSVQEGVWRWVAGPEAGEQFWQGNGAGSRVNGMFANWANNEPNNANPGEHCAEFRTSAGGRWNDIPCDNPRPYYVVEFGTEEAEGLPQVTVTSFTVTIDLMIGNEVMSCGVVIDESGTYTLGEDLTLGTFQDVCITVTADDVTLVGGGHTITGHVNDYTQAVLVDEVENVSISGLTISSFVDGIFVQDSSALVIENNTISNLTGNGVDVNDSSDTQILNNEISNTEYSGIWVYRSLDGAGTQSAIIRGNTLTETGGGDAEGGYEGSINVEEPQDTIIENNTITVTKEDVPAIAVRESISFDIKDNEIEAEGRGIVATDHVTLFRDRAITNNTIKSGDWAISLDLGQTTILGNTIQSDKWVNDTVGNTYDNGTSGNRYYFANGDGAWKVFDIKDSNGDKWSDVGNDLPFTDGLSFELEGEEIVLWEGAGEDAHPYTEIAVASNSSTKRKVVGITGAARAATAQSTTQSTDAQTNTQDGTCAADQILTQNLKAGARNGRYHSYTKAIVTEVKILQAHMNRLGFNAGVVDGILGPITDGAIKRMQTYLGTKADGYVGPITRGLINTSCGAEGLKKN